MAILKFNYEKIPDPDLYLERIRYTGKLDLTQDTLHELVFAHQCAIPYETLSVSYLQERVDISTKGLFDKIIRGGRGGYCYELNGLFTHLLRTLGFEAYSCMGRVAWGMPEPGAAGHRGTLVYIDGREYFCDVGFSGPSPTFALETVDRFQARHFENDFYWVQPAGNGWRAVMRSHEKDRRMGKAVSVFGTDHFMDADFIYGNYFTSQSPDSMFKLNRTVALKTKEGYRKIKGMEYIEYANGVKIVRPYKESEFRELLLDKFGLILPDKAPANEKTDIL